MILEDATQIDNIGARDGMGKRLRGGESRKTSLV